MLRVLFPKEDLGGGRGGWGGHEQLCLKVVYEFQEKGRSVQKDVCNKDSKKKRKLEYVVVAIQLMGRFEG